MARGARILSTGAYLPERRVPNEALTHFPAASLPLVAQKTGVKARHYAAEGQFTSDLAAAAARNCLGTAGIGAAGVHAIILATSSPDRLHPATATRVQELIGATGAFAFDVNSVCSGAIYAIHLARALIGSGMSDSVLVIGAEIYSRFLNPKDFSTYPYFGDGAGALLLGPVDDGGGGILHSICRSDGSGADTIQVPAGGTMLPVATLADPDDAFFRMRGRQVYDFAVQKGSEVVRELLDAARTPISDVAKIIPHQANVNILREQAARLGIEPERFFVNLDRVGNTAAASIPIALDEAVKSGAVRPGDLIVLVGFGGGLSWGATLVRL
jgi:3-oxoacyl-[acyl-carrier-protein] synthase-3